jgi:sRNA-binding regulator protein Hfq
MNTEADVPSPRKQFSIRPLRAEARIVSRPVAPFRLSAQEPPPEPSQRSSEFFYLQKQIQAQTPMVLVLEDGEVVEGCIEWYDRNVLKVRGSAKTLVYKSAIKYMYKRDEPRQ